MISALVVLTVGAALLVPQSPIDRGIDATAAEQQDSVAVASARQQPDSARTIIARLLSRSVSQSTEISRNRDIASARQVADAYAIAWRDSFFVRQVNTFENWNVVERSSRIRTDSLRRAGNEALSRRGVPTALKLWNASLRLATALSDSAGQAAALGNIGGALYRQEKIDSALLFFSRSRDIAVAIGDQRTAGNAVGMLATIAMQRSDTERAQQLYARAAEIRALSGDSRGVAADHNNLGLIAQSLGDLGGARRAFEKALRINHEDGRGPVAAVNLANLANVASITSDFAAADTLYGAAVAIYRSTGMLAELSAVLHNVGLLELRRGDYERARATFVEALTLADSTGAGSESVTIRIDLATAFAAMGKLQAALATLRRAEAVAVRSSAGATTSARLALARADLSVQFNNLSDAERQYARASIQFARARDEPGRAASLQGQGVIQLLRSDNVGAARLFGRVRQAQVLAGDKHAAAFTQLLEGYSLAQTRDTLNARRTLLAALGSLAATGDVVGEAQAFSVLGDFANRFGHTRDAESYYHRGLNRLANLPAADARWQLHAGLGSALQNRGAIVDAADELRAAVAEIERMSSSLPLEERRSAFLSDKWTVFAKLALLEEKRGQAGESFAVSERLRARQLLDMLARGQVTLRDSVRDNARDGDRDIMKTREQNLRQQIAELSRGRVSNIGSAQPLRGPVADTRVRNSTREALDSAQKAYAALLLEMRERNPSYARLISGETAPWRSVAARLGSDQVLLEYLTTDSASVVYVITRDTVATIRIPLSRRELARQIDFARETMSNPALNGANALWRSPMRRLGQVLIGPVEAAGYLAGKRGLIIVPHGELHFLPFEALLTGADAGRFLVERFSVTYAPSASLWVQLNARQRHVPLDDVLVFAPRSDALPASATEARAIGRSFGARAAVFVGAAATEKEFRAQAPTKSIIHIATYGVLSKHNPLFSFVELAPEGADDGRLEVNEVFELKLNARLVVLSACQTAVGSGAIADVPPGDDWVGLVQGFLYAGASNVLATLWPVEDGSTAQLMTNFYRELAAGRTEGEALAEAKRAAIKDARTSHPFYWAGFVMSGGGR